MSTNQTEHVTFICTVMSTNPQAICKRRNHYQCSNELNSITNIEFIALKFFHECHVGAPIVQMKPVTSYNY